MAVIISTGPVIDFCFMSETLKSLSQLTWLRKGTPVPKGTATGQLNADARRVSDGDRAEEEIDVRDWLGGSHSVQTIEQVVGLGSYGSTLTVLSCPSLEDEAYHEDDGDNDEDLVERWTPRFRR